MTNHESIVGHNNLKDPYLLIQDYAHLAFQEVLVQENLLGSVTANVPLFLLGDSPWNISPILVGSKLKLNCALWNPMSTYFLHSGYLLIS